jgi:phosphoribosylaminoimidazole-succinocarboxamide synthase
MYMGKVRNTYSLPGYPNLLLVITTNRLSIFDFVLNCYVALKGEVLNALTIFWLTGPLKKYANHLVAYGEGMDQYLPVDLRGNKELRKRAMIVKKLEIIPIEHVVRGFLTGSGLESYTNTGKVCGHYLPLGLHDGSKLPISLYTPTSKEDEGHDEHIDYQVVRERYGNVLEEFALDVYSTGYSYAASCGVIIADTKFETGYDPTEGINVLRLADEVLTPDSSRFWDTKEYRLAQANQKAPAGFDKQPVREHGKTITTPFTDESGATIVGINKLSPNNPEHVEFVHSCVIPDEITGAATGRYRNILNRLVKSELETYQDQYLQAA